MPIKLNTNSADFEARFATIISESQNVLSDAAPIVSDIIQRVINEGDAVLYELTEKFDRCKLDTLAISPAKRDALAKKSTITASLKEAANRIEAYHKKQLPEDCLYEDEVGVTLGWKWTAIESVGIYVPGGLATYPSSVLMNAIPAKVAGVKRIVMVVPTPNGEISPDVMAAAKIANIDEIYTIGGAQAVAALAYGTETIKPVDKIVGPGNKFVAEAKRQVFGKVGIDMIAGPSEILVVADNKNNPEWMAIDLLSQAEHDSVARAILITDDEAFADAVEQAVEKQLQKLPKETIARKSWENNGAIIVIPSNSLSIEGEGWGEGANIINRIAPEHLELAIDNPEILLKRISNAGAIFLGRYTPEAIGDYVAGPSHVLPTSTSARFSSGLGVFDFIKRSSIIGCSQEAFNKIAADGIVIAEAEGLDAHAKSIKVRL